jgi:hypothetical protein
MFIGKHTNQVSFAHSKYDLQQMPDDPEEKGVKRKGLI